MLSCKIVVLLVALGLGVMANPEDTAYYGDSQTVYFSVYRVNDRLQDLDNNGLNAASPGGEVGFLSNEYQYSDGVISQHCIEMTNATFQSYQCCNGGQCSVCGYAGSANGGSQMPGRSYQLYPPPGAPCNQNNNCGGTPGVDCPGECSGWWYSFSPGTGCTSGQALGTNGCTWRASEIATTIQYADLLTKDSFYTCEVTQYNPPGGCSGYLAWNYFSANVNSLVKRFQNHAVSFMHIASSNTWANTTVPVRADPQWQCRAPCPAGSFSSTGFQTTSSSCQWCPIGTYASSQASGTCTSCPSGYTTNAAGSTSYSQCVYNGGGGTSDGGDADADGASFLASSNGRSSRHALPSYAVAVIAIGGFAVVAAAVIAVVAIMRRRRAASLPDVELQQSDL